MKLNRNIIDYVLNQFQYYYSRKLLIIKMKKFGQSNNIIWVVQKMLDWFKLKYRDKIIDAQIGLTQGSTLTPILFKIFLNNLLNNFEKDGIKSLAYADETT